MPKYGLAHGEHIDIDAVYPKDDDHTCHGRCSCCGQCCVHHLQVLPSEIKRIQAYIQKHQIEPFRHASPDAVASIDFLCPFLDNSGPSAKCLIYPVRPAICQAYICGDRQQIINQNYEKLFQNNKVSVIEFLHNMREVDVGQTFYPDSYAPKPGDLVVINQLHMLEHLDHKTDVFLLKLGSRETNGMTEVPLKPLNGDLSLTNKPDFWFDIQGLTKIETPVPIPKGGMTDG